MDYWHIQMHLPEGKDGTIIDSIKMLQEPKPVIGTGEWDDLQCKYFKGEQNGLNLGSIVMVRKGKQPLALCKVMGDWFFDEDLEDKYINRLYRHVEILDWNNEGKTSSLFTQGTLKRLYESADTDSWNYINDWYIKTIKMADLKKCVELLKFKKQIILQGPPGTGKTRMAKEIARELTAPAKLSEIDIKTALFPNLVISSATEYTNYTIKHIGTINVTVGLENSTREYKPSFKEIITAYGIKMWEGKQEKGNDPYAAAIAKYIYQRIGVDRSKLIQFHPSYSYEDFVRGIVAKANDNGDGIIYEAENKILAEFALRANENFLDSKKSSTTLSKEHWVAHRFEEFAESISDKIDEIGAFNLTENVDIIKIENKSFYYTGKTWNGNPHRMPFKDIIQAYLDGNTERQDLKNNNNISGSAKQHASYYIRILKSFIAFLAGRKYSGNEVAEVKEKDFVLIIDEINRADLSSVLGELIYALEYRGEKVESVYAVNGETELVLPPNLYIVGTMNTADRSIGPIDYAIRRRFAFVDILPRDLSNEQDVIFHKKLFDIVANLFDTNLSPEFNKKDVQLGHSYFIDKSKDGVPMSIRLQYEIKPILIEYVKGGILIGEVNGIDIVEQINSLTV